MEKYDEKITSLPLSAIRANPKQPRTHFDEKELKSLSQSIQKYGMIQPIVVRPSAIYGYEIIAGERRFRASQLVGMTEIPAIIRTNLDANQVETVALLENIQRQNLNPIEEALAYQNILNNQALTQEQLADQVGKSRTYLTNMLRLLALPELIQEMVIKQSLSNAQARTLLAVKNKHEQLQLAKRAVAEGLTVRQLEKMVREQKKTTVQKVKKEDIFLNDLTEQMKRHFGTTVEIKGNQNQGKIELHYADLDELNRIIDLINGDNLEQL